VAVQGANVEALTGDETFRVALSSCLLESEGRKIVVRDQRSPLVIWSDDDGFLRALERAQRGILKSQVRRIEAAARRWRFLKWCGVAAVVAAAVCVAAAPITRWAVGGGVPSIANRIGESALERLALADEVAPEVDRALLTIAELVRPATAPSTRSFRLLLAEFTEKHIFAFPPSTVIVTAGLICAASGPDVVMERVAEELAHLERRDVSSRLAEAAGWHTAVDLARGDTTALRARLLEFADPTRYPGYTLEQQTAAKVRAGVMLASATARAIADQGSSHAAGIEWGLDWSKVRGEACGLIGVPHAGE
jgi:hypothetical protein